MERFTRENLATLYGNPIYGSDGQKIGDVSEVLFDTKSREPEWVTVNTGFLGMRSKIVPLSGAGFERDGLCVPFTKDQVKGAPDVSLSDGAISERDEQTLWNHFGVGRGAGTTAERSGFVGRTEHAGQTGQDTGGQHRVELREEELRTQKENVQAGEVQVRKDVVTENRTLDVPVTHEEVYVERHPVSGREASGRPIGEGETIRVPVHEEEVHVEKRPVVREELEIGKRRVTETEQVSGTVRREEAHIERTGDVDVCGEGETGGYEHR